MAFGHSGATSQRFHAEMRGRNQFTRARIGGRFEVVLPKVYKTPGSPSIQVRELGIGRLRFEDYRNLVPWIGESSCCGAALLDHPSGQYCICTGCDSVDEAFDG